MKQFLCFPAALCLLLSASGQPVPAALKAGDLVPNITLTNIMNAGTGASPLSAFKKKLVLLNFWATNCGACAAEMPVLDSLQHAYPRELSILMVTSNKGETKEKVAKVFNRIRTNTGWQVQLPVILDAPLLNGYFPHEYVPYYAWLDSSLRVVAITGGEEASPQSIAAYIKGEKKSFMQKEDMSGFDKTAPLFIKSNGGSGATLRMRSSLCNYIPGLPTFTQVNKNTSGLVTGILLSNLSLVSLTRFAYNYYAGDFTIHFPPGEDSLLSTSGKSPEWITGHAYTYELVTPPIPAAVAMQYLKEDLRRFFGYGATIKKISRSCLVLTADSPVLRKYNTQGGQKINSLSHPIHPQFKNESMAVIATALSNRLSLPVIDESGYHTRVDIDLTGINPQDMPSVKAVFAKYGIILTETERPFEELFIDHLPN